LAINKRLFCGDVDLFFKLEEEGMLALLLHLLKVVAETAVSGSVAGFCCRLVVATVQPTQQAKASSTSTAQTDQAF
jgi:hypothetical protein